ncbi:hypothetical protein J2X04_001626 [Lysobacter niabensis]|uniref:Uncharacterized protein n=1 Tax=Agrilutibacter niabensis TaxID=380628 RepID=A0ABU1VP73_9GAMM|nr:hypothetical protein [Lysobacter niabensis]MDR7099279.1 hypothetical protein [Lysobacter niabensis]
MSHTLRWLLLFPIVALSVLASWLLYPLAHGLTLLACPQPFRGSESTTDLSQPDYSATFATCSTGWFPAVDVSLMVAAILLSVVVAGLVGYRLPPSHQRLSAALSSLLVIGVVAAAFAYGP